MISATGSPELGAQPGEGQACQLGLGLATATDKRNPAGRKRSAPDNPGCDEDVSDFNCSICTDLLVEPVTGICGHEFCKYCLEKWRSSIPNSRSAVLCPRCRGVIASNPTKQFGVCRLLERVLRKMFPEEYARRLLEVQQAREQDAKAVHDQVEAHVAAVQSMLAESLTTLAPQQPQSRTPTPSPLAPDPPTAQPTIPTADAPSSTTWIHPPNPSPPIASLPPLPPVPTIRTRATLFLPPQPPNQSLRGTSQPLSTSHPTTTVPAANATATTTTLPWRALSPPPPVWAHPSSPQYSVFSAMSSLFSPRASHMVTGGGGGSITASHMFTGGFTGGGSTLVSSPTRHVMFRPAGPIFGPVPSHRPRQRRASQPAMHPPLPIDTSGLPIVSPLPTPLMSPPAAAAVAPSRDGAAAATPGVISNHAPLGGSSANGSMSMCTQTIASTQAQDTMPPPSWLPRPLHMQPVAVQGPATAHIAITDAHGPSQPCVLQAPLASVGPPAAPSHITLPASSSIRCTAGHSSLTHHIHESGTDGDPRCCAQALASTSNPAVLNAQGTGLAGGRDQDVAIAVVGGQLEEEISHSGSMSDSDAGSLLADEDELDGEVEVLGAAQGDASPSHPHHQQSSGVPLPSISGALPHILTSHDVSSGPAVSLGSVLPAAASPPQPSHASGAALDTMPMQSPAPSLCFQTGNMAFEARQTPAACMAALSSHQASPRVFAASAVRPCGMDMEAVHGQASCSRSCLHGDCMGAPAPSWVQPRAIAMAWEGAGTAELEDEGVPDGLQLQAQDCLMVESLEVRLAAARSQPAVQPLSHVVLSNRGGTPVRGDRAGTSAGIGQGSVSKRRVKRGDASGMGWTPEGVRMPVGRMGQGEQQAPACSGDSSACAGHHSGVESDTTAPGRVYYASAVVPFPQLAAMPQAREGVADTDGYSDEVPQTPWRNPREGEPEEGDADIVGTPSSALSIRGQPLSRPGRAPRSSAGEIAGDAGDAEALVHIAQGCSSVVREDVNGGVLPGPAPPMMKRISHASNRSLVDGNANDTAAAAVAMTACPVAPPPITSTIVQTSPAATLTLAPTTGAVTAYDNTHTHQWHTSATEHHYSHQPVASIQPNTSTPSNQMPIHQSAGDSAMPMPQAVHPPGPTHTLVPDMQHMRHDVHASSFVTPPSLHGASDTGTTYPHPFMEHHHTLNMLMPYLNSPHAFFLPMLPHTFAPPSCPPPAPPPSTSTDLHHPQHAPPPPPPPPPAPITAPPRLSPGTTMPPHPVPLRMPPAPTQAAAAVSPHMLSGAPPQPSPHGPSPSDPMDVLLQYQPASSVHLSSPLAGNWHNPMADLPMRQAVVRYIIEALLANHATRLKQERAATFQQFVAKVENALYRGAPTAEAYSDRSTIMQRFLTLRKRLLDAQAQAPGVRGSQGGTTARV